MKSGRKSQNGLNYTDPYLLAKHVIDAWLREIETSYQAGRPARIGTDKSIELRDAITYVITLAEISNAQHYQTKSSRKQILQ